MLRAKVQQVVVVEVGGMVRSHVALQVAAARQRLAAYGARMVAPRPACSALPRVQAHVLVEVAGVPEGAQAVPAPQRLVPGVRADVDLEAVAAGVQLAAVHAHVPRAAAHSPPRRRKRLQLRRVPHCRRQH